MKIFGAYRPRFRTSLRYKFRLFALLLTSIPVFLAFQNFTNIPFEKPFENVINARVVEIKNINEARAFQTSNGPFTIIKGDNGRPVEVDYLNNLDVSGKNCFRLAQMATQTRQHLRVVGIPAIATPSGVIMFQRVLDCRLDPLVESAAQNFNSK